MRQKGIYDYSLFNPFCFQGYLREILQVYLNSDVLVSKKKEYLDKKIEKSLKEFKVMTMGMISDFDQEKMFVNDGYFRECFYKIKKILP